MSVKDSQAFGLRLAKLREARGFTQLDLANRLSVNKNTIQKIEYGISEPRAGTVISLCEVLHCTPNELFPERLSEDNGRRREIKAVEEKLLRMPNYAYRRCMELINKVIDMVLDLIA